MVSKKEKIHIQYVNSAGIKVPGTTTILGLLAKPALIHWAWKCGVDGIDYRKKRDTAGDIGTLAHYLIECSIKELKPEVSEYSPAQLEKAENAYLAWLEWKGTFGEIETIASECPLVCDTFGGTMDWIIRKNSKHILVDFKTGKAIYSPEMPCQLAAYRYLWNVNNPNEKINECYILRVGKENGEFEQKRYVNLDKELKLFFHLRDVYLLKKEINRLKG